MHRAARVFILICASLIGGAGLCLAGPTGEPLSESECRAIWNEGAGRSGYFGPDGAKPYIDGFAAVDTNHDNKISNAEFKAGCAAGLVHKFKSQS